ncbi:helix-turn-helix transcriptional regulator [Actinophytocola sp.]|uniref:helix-turn-helix domain-containing protein n=1 Tax=Actinophytocola sp. TaxID=1872138 RepID=UPI002D7EA7F2|nr:helix-turn-helix transcriptional regulator [Actinophytocola sp.]HET9140571.1 helix-turn-helix transcriptional regulator [Actinophytocola sp.]
MPGNPHTSVRSRAVAAELRSLRESRGMSCAEVAKLLGVSASKISRIETGNSGMQVDDVAALLGFYRVPTARRQELLDLLRRGTQRGWWQRQPGIPQRWRALFEAESKAVRILNYEPLVIPGLLQTSEYSAAMIEGVEPAIASADLDNLVATRMARQTLLTRASAPHLVAVVYEVALRAPIGAPGVMKRQLQHLASVSERPNVDMRIVPVDAGAHAGLRGPIVILEFADEASMGFVENHDTGLFIEEGVELERYRLAMRNILGLALSPDESAGLVAAVAAESG